MLNIQKYFLENNNHPLDLQEKIDYLKNTLNLNIKIQDNKILLNYRIDSPKDSPIVNECRGLILDKNTFEVICYPFNRFYNYGEGYAAKIDWESAEIFEKLDGTAIFLWWDKEFNKWQVSTRNMIYADGLVNENPLLSTKQRTFAQLFWEIFKEKFQYTDKYNKDFTYCFELCSLENKVFKEYKERDIVLLTTRNNKTLTEFEQCDSDIIARNRMLTRPKRYKLSTLTLETVIKLIKDLDFKPYDEGFVVCDKYNNRIKVKNPDYFIYSALKNNGNVEKNIVKLIVNNERDEFLSYFPEYTKTYDKLREKYFMLIKSAEILYIEVQDKASQKDFALSILFHPLSSLLFSIRAKKYSCFDDAVKDNLQLIEKVLLQ